MRSLILSILFVATLGIAIPEYSQAQTLNSDKLSAKNNNQSLKKVLGNAVGEYPYDCKIFQNKLLKSRLIKLLGPKRFNYMINNFDVQTPIEHQNFMFHFFACQAHNCGSTEFEISYNHIDDNLCVRYRVDDKETIFKEKKGRAYWD